MSTIVKDLSMNSLVEAMAVNNAGFVGLFDSADGVVNGRERGIEWYMTGVRFPLFNGVTETILSDEDADTAIEHIIGRFKKERMPMIWSVTPLSRPGDLGQRLIAHGLQHGVDSPSMAVEIDSLPKIIELQDGFTIELVADDGALHTWCDILGTIFRFPAFVGEALFKFMAYIGHDSGSLVKNYIGRADGEPVVVSTLLLSGGVAGIYNVGTVEHARRRGYGRSITLAPLFDARDSGYRIGVLQSTAMGRSLYESLGFREYCTFSRYLWLPESIS
jgi:hypothetical protein